MGNVMGDNEYQWFRKIQNIPENLGLELDTAIVSIWCHESYLGGNG